MVLDSLTKYTPVHIIWDTCQFMKQNGQMWKYKGDGKTDATSTNFW